MYFRIARYAASQSKKVLKNKQVHFFVMARSGYSALLIKSFKQVSWTMNLIEGLVFCRLNQTAAFAVFPWAGIDQGNNGQERVDHAQGNSTGAT